MGCVGLKWLSAKKFNLAFINIIVDYFQVLSLFSRIKIKWPPFIKQVSKSSERERASRIWKHCSYRRDFLLVGFSFNVFYGVTAFKQAQTVYTKKSNIEM